VLKLAGPQTLLVRSGALDYVREAYAGGEDAVVLEAIAVGQQAGLTQAAEERLAVFAPVVVAGRHALWRRIDANRDRT
jgi:hypothetical protein